MVRSKTSKTLFAVLSLCVLFSSQGLAHSRLKATASVAPRSTDPGIKEANAPCGPNPRVTPKVFAPGSTITVDWEETINHPGQYEFYFSAANDANFVLLKTVVDTQDAGIVGTAYHQYSTTITFPAGVSCDNCTLQMIQLMTDRNPPTRYFSCADVRLTATPNVPPAPAPMPTPAPTPSPTPTTPAPGDDHCGR